ncbi:MAG: microviridin/marinostatin family tricyclic proteinase inhibitor [Pyrinomonadaceae bacterium]
MSDTTDANARRDSVPSEGSLPFFARFLEGQNHEERSAATTKYPSDLDEFMTMKYPSDGDDDYPTEDSVVQASPERKQTLKYPSDREPFNDSTLQAAPDRLRTLKYPSDRDEDIDPFRNS